VIPAQTFAASKKQLVATKCAIRAWWLNHLRDLITDAGVWNSVRQRAHNGLVMLFCRWGLLDVGVLDAWKSSPHLDAAGFVLTEPSLNSVYQCAPCGSPWLATFYCGSSLRCCSNQHPSDWTGLFMVTSNQVKMSDFRTHPSSLPPQPALSLYGSLRRGRMLIVHVQATL
jgi:hypothetical protein